MHFSSRRTVLRGFAALLLLCGFLFTVSVAGAVSDAQTSSPPAAVPIDAFCATGSVIDFMELPSAGWTITAVMYDPATGLLDPATAVNVDTTNVDDSADGPLGSFRFDNLSAGKWNFSIGTQAGWSPVTPASFDVSFAYGRTDCATIRFKMRQDVIVNVLKIDDTHQPLADYTIYAEPGIGNYFASTIILTTGADGKATFVLTPGLWEFYEVPPSGVNVSPVSPATAHQSLNVVAPGPYDIRFKNRVTNNLGCIQVIKRDVPPAGSNQPPMGLSGWPISVLRSDNTIAADGFTDAIGEIAFDNLPFGPYTVYEQLPPSGWEAVSATRYSVTVDNNADCVQVEFTNRQVEPAFCITGRKVDTNGWVGLPGWEITATPLDSTNFAPDAVTTDGLGYFRIDLPLNDYRIPNSEYNVCETIADGWLAHTATCQIVRLPDYPGACVNLDYDFENQQVGHTSTPSSTPPAGCSATYTVKAGDQFNQIARSHGKSPKELSDANPSIKNLNLIWPGQIICIP